MRFIKLDIQQYLFFLKLHIEKERKHANETINFFTLLL